MDKPGYYLGRHYSFYYSQLLEMAQEGRIIELEELLGHLIDALEAESLVDQQEVPALLYSVLLDVLRSRHAPARDELALLERFLRQPRIATRERVWAEEHVLRVRGRLVA